MLIACVVMNVYQFVKIVSSALIVEDMVLNICAMAAANVQVAYKAPFAAIATNVPAVRAAIIVQAIAVIYVRAVMTLFALIAGFVPIV